MFPGWNDVRQNNMTLQLSKYEEKLQIFMPKKYMLILDSGENMLWGKTYAPSLKVKKKVGP